MFILTIINYVFGTACLIPHCIAHESADFVVVLVEDNRLTDVSAMTDCLTNFLACPVDASWLKLAIEFLLLTIAVESQGV